MAILVNKTASVFHHFADGKTRFFGLMNTASIDKSIDTEEIRAGEAWGVKALMYTNPSMELTLIPAFWDDFFIEDAAGSVFENAVATTLPENEAITFVLSTADATATMTGTPVDDEVQVQDSTGKLWAATFAAGTITVVGGAALAGTSGYALFKIAVTGDVLTFESEKYPEVHGITLRTSAIDTDSNKIVANLYFAFDNVVSDGSLALALAGATNSITEVKAKVLPNALGEFGKYTIVKVTA